MFLFQIPKGFILETERNLKLWHLVVDTLLQGPECAVIHKGDAGRMASSA